MPTLYSAPAVVTGDGRCLHDAGVLVEGERVAAVAPVAELDADGPRRHHVHGVLLPGLVDAATLVELSDATEPRDDAGPRDATAERSDAAEPRDADPGLDPARALARVAGDEAVAAGWSDDRRQRSARRGAHQLVRAGVGLTVDHVRWGLGVPALARTRLPGDSLVDVGAVTAGEADEVAAALRARLARRAPAGRRVGVAVGAPDDTDLAALTAVVDAAGDAPLRVTTRPGQPVDAEALAHAGALRPGVTVGPNPALDAAGADRLARAGVTVLAVPRAASPPELGALAEGGADVVLGAGLTADPDPLAGAAAFARLAADAGLTAWPPDSGTPPAEAALARVTGLGAARLGWGETAAVLAAGRRADLVALEDGGAASGHPQAVLAAAGRQVLTVVGGVQRARRARADEPWPPIDRQEWRDEA